MVESTSYSLIVELYHQYFYNYECGFDRLKELS